MLKGTSQKPQGKLATAYSQTEVYRATALGGKADVVDNSSSNPPTYVMESRRIEAIARPRLFLIYARRLPQHEMAKRRSDGLGRVVLPGLRFESDDAPALLDD